MCTLRSAGSSEVSPSSRTRSIAEAGLQHHTLVLWPRWRKGTQKTGMCEVKLLAIAGWLPFPTTQWRPELRSLLCAWAQVHQGIVDEGVGLAWREPCRALVLDGSLQREGL